MGVDHGETVGQVSQNLEGEDASGNYPQILSCFKISSTRLLKALPYDRYKKECSVAFKICQNAFPDPAGRAHDAPRPPSQLKREGTPLPCPNFGAHHAFQVPPEFQPDLHLCPEASSTVTIYTHHALRDMNLAKYSFSGQKFASSNKRRCLGVEACGKFAACPFLNPAPRLCYQFLSTECITLHHSNAKLHCNYPCHNDLTHKHYTSG